MRTVPTRVARTIAVVVVAAFASLAAASGCELIASVDRDKIPGSSGSGGAGGGTGGSGGAVTTSSTGGSGGASSSASSSGTGASGGGGAGGGCANPCTN